MKNRPHFNKICRFVKEAVGNTGKEEEEVPLARFGTICCRRRQRITEVPFFSPSLIMVMAGQKSLYYNNREVRCSPGDYFAVPAPSRFDMVNTPDNRQNTYMALFLPFDTEIVERFYRIHNVDVKNDAAVSMRAEGTPLLDSAVWHYLEMSSRPDPEHDVLEHRLMEILLCLVKHNNASHMLLSMSKKWSERLSSLLLSDPARPWQMGDVCKLLAVGESTLRRNLRDEATSFRSILDDIRMGLALSLVQCTKQPISLIAESCGYRSLPRFTERFRGRFNTTPTELRKD